jgi:hypothetical protein
MTIRVICVHGIGAHEPDFVTSWAPLLQAAAPDATFRVHGLHWNDLLEQARKQYLSLDPRLGEAINAFGITVPDLLDSAAGYFVREYAFDVVSYCGLAEMRRHILAQCTVRLDQLSGRQDPDNPQRERGCILLGHSLGAALLLHLTELEHQETSALNWRGMVLLGHPLGVVSPLAHVLPDPLSCTPGADPSRDRTLGNASAHWRTGGRGRLHVLENTNDVVCSDVKMVLGGAQFDPIPIRQGLSEAEVKAIHRYNPGAVQRFTAGSPQPDAIAQNHAVSTYLKQPAFVSVFRSLLA